MLRPCFDRMNFGFALQGFPIPPRPRLYTGRRLRPFRRPEPSVRPRQHDNVPLCCCLMPRLVRPLLSVRVILGPFRPVSTEFVAHLARPPATNPSPPSTLRGPVPSLAHPRQSNDHDPFPCHPSRPVRADPTARGRPWRSRPNRLGQPCASRLRYRGVGGGVHAHPTHVSNRWPAPGGRRATTTSLFVPTPIRALSDLSRSAGRAPGCWR